MMASRPRMPRTNSNRTPRLGLGTPCGRAIASPRSLLCHPNRCKTVRSQIPPAVDSKLLAQISENRTDRSKPQALSAKYRRLRKRAVAYGKAHRKLLVRSYRQTNSLAPDLMVHHPKPANSLDQIQEIDGNSIRPIENQYRARRPRFPLIDRREVEPEIPWRLMPPTP